MRDISAVFYILMFYEIASYPISNMFVCMFFSTDAHVRLKETGLSIRVLLSRYVENIPAELRNACQKPGNLFDFTTDLINVSTPVILHFTPL